MNLEVNKTCQREGCNNKDVMSINWKWYKYGDGWKYDLYWNNWIDLCEEHVIQSYKWVFKEQVK